MQKCGITTIETVKIWNFANKFSREGKLFARFLQNSQTTTPIIWQRKKLDSFNRKGI